MIEMINLKIVDLASKENKLEDCIEKPKLIKGSFWKPHKFNQID